MPIWIVQYSPPWFIYLMYFLCVQWPPTQTWGITPESADLTDPPASFENKSHWHNEFSAGQVTLCSKFSLILILTIFYKPTTHYSLKIFSRIKPSQSNCLSYHHHPKIIIVLYSFGQVARLTVRTEYAGNQQVINWPKNEKQCVQRKLWSSFSNMSI